MSRAYRIRIKESITRDVSVSDEICSDLEILEILPKEQMTDLLKGELERRGYKDDNGKMSKTNDGVTVSVDPNSGEVAVKSEKAGTVEVETDKEGWGYDDVGPTEKAIRAGLVEEAKEELEARIKRQQDKMQTEATKKLEAEMDEIRKELNEAVNVITRDALKRKAASMGRIKEMTEDPEAGNLTITVEV